MLISVLYGSIFMLHIPPAEVLISPNSSNKNKKRQEPHKTAYLSENGGIGKKSFGTQRQLKLGEQLIPVSTS